MDSKNKISIFAENATVTSQEQVGSIAYCYDDATWRGTTETPFSPRYKGSVEGIAKSIEYNTALRQATVMSAVLAEILVKRNSKSSDNGYANMAVNGIGTSWLQETSLDAHISNLANIFSNGKFLNDSEVITSKINAKAVTTAKIADNAVTSNQLGSILGSSSSSSNGMTVTLSQSGSKGAVSIQISGNTVTNSDNNKITTSSNKEYITGSDSTSGYNQLKTNSAVYMQAGTIYSTNMINTGYVQAQSFYATSDIRLKNIISKLDAKVVKDIIENTEIVNFKYKKGKEEFIGIIAQDVEHKNLGGFNLTDVDNDGYLRIKEDKIIYILWEYIKQLEKRVKKLEK